MIAQLDWQYIKTRPYKAAIRIITHLFFQGRFLTTRYRWLNRIILTELRIVRNLPSKRMVEKPIFIIGIGRSGSTILGKILSMHRSIGFLNEPKAIWYTVDPRDDVNGHFHQGKAFFRFSENDATPQKIKFAHNIFGFYSYLTGSRRILDKNPESLYRIPYIRRIFPDAKFILLIRDGWDTITSIITWSRINRKTRNGYLEDWWGLNRRKWKLIVEQLVPEEPLFEDCRDEIGLLTREEDMASVEWIISMQEGIRSLERWPDAVMPVYYEELIQNPIRELDKIISFCDLEADDIFLNYANDTIILNKHRSRVEISPKILYAFEMTMEALNYRYAITS